MINQYNESVGAFSLKCTNVEIRRKTLKYVEIGKTSNTFSDPKILRTHILNNYSFHQQQLMRRVRKIIYIKSLIITDQVNTIVYIRTQ